MGDKKKDPRSCSIDSFWAEEGRSRREEEGEEEKNENTSVSLPLSLSLFSFAKDVSRKLSQKLSLYS